MRAIYEVMEHDADELLKEHALRDPTICSRCFEETMPSSAEKDHYGGTPCGEKCGNLGISMESAPQSTNKMLHRGDNLLSVFEEGDIEVDSEIFQQAIEHEASSRPPQEVIIRAIEYGMGQRTPSWLNNKSEDETQNKITSIGGMRTHSKDVPTILSEGPITPGLLNRKNADPEIREYLAEFRDPEFDTIVLYLEDPDDFAEEFDIEDVSQHSAFDVAKKVVYVNWNELRSYSPTRIKNWIDDVDDRYSRHILSAAVLRGPSPLTKSSPPHQDSYRETSFWPLVKEQIAQPIIGVIRKENAPVSIEEIAEEVDEREQVVGKVLGILTEHETVRGKDSEEGWQYVEPEDRDFREPDQ